MDIFEIGVYAIEAGNGSGNRLRHDCISNVVEFSRLMNGSPIYYYIGSAEGHEYPDLQVGDEVNPRPFFVLS